MVPAFNKPLTKYLFYQVCLCGREDVEDSSKGSRIVGGQESDPNKHPWQVATCLELSSLISQVSLEKIHNGTHHCGGSLISKYILNLGFVWYLPASRRHVLTAAHCMDGVAMEEIPQLLKVVLGLHDLRKVPFQHEYNIIQPVLFPAMARRLNVLKLPKFTCQPISLGIPWLEMG